VRRLRIACAVTVLTLLGFAVALKLSAASPARDGRDGTAASASQYSSTREGSDAAKGETSPEAAGSAPAASNAPVIVATSISARSLAVEPQPQSSVNSASAENLSAPQSALLYLANADKGNRIFTLAATLNPPGSVNSLASSSKFALFAGQASPGSLGDGGVASGAEFDLKLDSLAMRSGVAVAPDGTIFVADTLNGTIRSIAGAASSEPGIVRSVVGRYGPRQNFELVEPLGLALDRDSNLYIADRGANAVLMLHSALSASPGVLEILGHVISPTSVSVTWDGGKVFVASADTGSIVTINTKTRSIASAGVSTANLAVDGQQRASAAKILPAGITVDGAGNLFVSFSGAGAGQDQILRLDAATSNVKTVARGLSSPGQIAFDSNGNLFIADQGTRRLLALRSAGVPANGVTLIPPANQTPYGPEPVAGTSPTQAFTLTNNSAGTITQITSGFQGADPGDFTVLNTSCTGTLLANTSCSLNVAFTPQATGARSASLAVTYTSTGVQNTLTAAVSGTADDYEITLASGAMQQLTIAQGFAATYLLQIVPDDTFSGTVTLLCPLGSALPAATTCGISAGTTVTTPLVPMLTVNVTAGTPVPFNVTFQTTSTATATSTSTTTSVVPGFGNFGRGDDMNWPGATLRNSAGFPAFSSLGSFGLFASLICAIFVFSVSGSGVKRVLSVLGVCAIFAVLLGGCHHSSTTGIVVTPKGTYNLTVQGTAQGATRGFTVTMVVD
jgi:sugar lactone lactonase YvrE